MVRRFIVALIFDIFPFRLFRPRTLASRPTPISPEIARLRGQVRDDGSVRDRARPSSRHCCIIAVTTADRPLLGAFAVHASETSVVRPTAGIHWWPFFFSSVFRQAEKQAKTPANPRRKLCPGRQGQDYRYITFRVYAIILQYYALLCISNKDKTRNSLPPILHPCPLNRQKQHWFERASICPSNFKRFSLFIDHLSTVGELLQSRCTIVYSHIVRWTIRSILF